MVSTRNHSWQAIQEKIRQRIQDRVWSPGELIPGEVALAEQFGCARTTVNRALRELAATGVIDRKRKAGTRVAEQQARRVTAEIPVIRVQVEQQGLAYAFTVLKCQQLQPPQKIRQAMQLRANTKALHIQSVHRADGKPYIFEDRWVNTQAVPDVLEVDLAETSINEWLVRHVPFTQGEFIVSVSPATASAAKALELKRGALVLSSTRSTWQDAQSVTIVGLYYCAGYELKFAI